MNLTTLLHHTQKKAVRWGRSLEKVGKATVSGLGAEEPMDRLEAGLQEVPAYQMLKRAAKAVVKEIFPQELPLYKDKNGPYKVKVHRQTWTDESRDREIPVKVYYPRERHDKSPVVFFSHGLAGNSVTYQYLGKHLASHGYTVVAPKHEGSDTTAVLKKTPIFSFTQEELQHRAADLRFVLDRLEEGNLPDDVMDNIDLNHKALAGHSFGALTTQAVAGVTTRDDSGEEIPLSDDRFDAFIAISPYGDSLPTEILGMDTKSYGNINKPVLFINGEEDDLFTFGKGALAHNVPFQKAGSKEKYQVIVDGADHTSFAQAIGLYDAEVVDMTNSASVAFLDAHLKEERPAQFYLSDQLAEVARSRDSQALVGNR